MTGAFLDEWQATSRQLQFWRSREIPSLELTVGRRSDEGSAVALALDTLACARRLRDAGFTEEQAEGQAAALAAAMTDSLATKQDLRELEARIDARFAAVDSRFLAVDARFVQLELMLAELEKRMALRFEQQTSIFDGKLSALEHRLTLRLGGITVASIGVTTALLKLT